MIEDTASNIERYEKSHVSYAHWIFSIELVLGSHSNLLLISGLDESST